MYVCIYIYIYIYLKITNTYISLRLVPLLRQQQLLKIAKTQEKNVSNGIHDNVNDNDDNKASPY